MDRSWLIVLGPKSRLPESGDLDLIPPVPPDRISAALQACRASIEPLDERPEGLRSVSLREGVLPLDLARAAEALASAVGPVTVVDLDTGLRVEVEAGTPLDRIVTEIANTARELEERERARTGARRASMDPPSFAPGRPEKRFLPPLKTALIAGFAMCWGWWMVKDRFTGCEKREVREPDRTPMGITESAMKFAHVLITVTKDGANKPEGWVQVSAASNLGSYPVWRAEDGKSYLCDGWHNPIRFARTRGGLRYSSCGPNGKDEHGQGDDVVRTYPEGSLP